MQPLLYSLENVVLAPDQRRGYTSNMPKSQIWNRLWRQHLSTHHNSRSRRALGKGVSCAQSLEGFRGINLSLPSGKLSAILGRNGSGKSTLLRTLAGLQPLYSGRIHHLGVDLESYSAPERARSIAWCPEGEEMPFDYLAHEYVAFARYPYGRADKCRRKVSAEQIGQAMETLDITHLYSRPLSTLSAGERRKLSLTRTFFSGARTILLDEPTAHLDLGSIERLFEALKHMTRGDSPHVLGYGGGGAAGQESRLCEGSHQKVSVVCVLHHLNVVQRYCDEVMVMEDLSVPLYGHLAGVIHTPEFSRILGLSL